MILKIIDVEKLGTVIDDFTSKTEKPCYKEACIWKDTIDVNCDNCSAILLSEHIKKHLPDCEIPLSDKKTQLTAIQPDYDPKHQNILDLD